MIGNFNLVNDNWMPVADHGKVSLRRAFSDSSLTSLGGNPVHKIAVLKLLLSIAQAACTPKSEAEWKALGTKGVAEKCLSYLERWEDRFNLTGTHPFLQMPAVKAAKVQPFGGVSPEVATGNTTVLSDWQMEKPLLDADKALLLVCLSGLALGGKQTDNSVVLTEGYTGKLNEKGKPSKVSKPGPSMGSQGFLHSFVLGPTLLQTVWLNLWTEEALSATGTYPGGIGRAPWESMPEGEDCPNAAFHKTTLQGRLVPLSRFCLLSKDGMHCSEGLAHPEYKDGVADPSVAINNSGKDVRALWADPSKRPWRELTALLSSIYESQSQGFRSHQVSLGLARVRQAVDAFGIWSGGLRASGDNFGQRVSGSDDYVESTIWLESELLGEVWFELLKAEMNDLDALSKTLYGRVKGYCNAQKLKSDNISAQANRVFWQLVERDFKGLLVACDPENKGGLPQMRRRFASYAHQVYDQFCPRGTSRQMESWAQNKPNTGKYLKQKES